MAITPKCPNPDCRAELANGSDVEKRLLTSHKDTYMYGVICAHCGIVIGIASVPRT
jgi:hypothetical protein